MKILTIGDPHGNLEKLKKLPLREADLILMTGDLGNANLARERYFENVEREKKGLPKLEDTPQFDKKCFMEIYDSSMKVLRYVSKFAPVYFIFGNVEPTIKKTNKRIKEVGESLPFFSHEARKIPNVRIINNVVANFHGIRIGGLEYFVDTNWVQDFKPSEYRKHLASAKVQTNKARRILEGFGKLDILIHHQPPYGVLDTVGGAAPKHWHGKHAGSRAILNYIKKYQPSYAFCGHIHEGEGSETLGNTKVYNLGVCGHLLFDIGGRS